MVRSSPLYPYKTPYHSVVFQNTRYSLLQFSKNSLISHPPRSLPPPYTLIRHPTSLISLTLVRRFAVLKFYCAIIMIISQIKPYSPTLQVRLPKWIVDSFKLGSFERISTTSGKFEQKMTTLKTTIHQLILWKCMFVRVLCKTGSLVHTT